MTIRRHETTENTLDLLRALKNYPDEALAPQEEFKVGTKTYYFSPGGSLYRKDPELKEEQEVANILSGYLSDELKLQRWRQVLRMSVSLTVGDRVQVRGNGGSSAAQKYASKEGYVSQIRGGLDQSTLIEVRFFGNNFDTVLKEEDLLSAKEGEKPGIEGEEPGIVGLLSGLESQSKLSQLLEEVFGVSPSEQPIVEQASSTFTFTLSRISDLRVSSLAPLPQPDGRYRQK